jgi:hypothetical protein
MSRRVTYICWLPLVIGAALPWTATESAILAVRNDDRTIITNPDTGRTFVPGETSTDRTIYNTVALFCTIVLAVFLGKGSIDFLGAWHITIMTCKPVY